ncbi:Hypothetical predicted protein [Olea europaea subsp. europaea]|uniref:Uncharacterized protein n=1 Tax=Olea europaea subsp. europaea TaxID=158383 RepID=A0A8S0T947_OLEEU|nr:Hypothetical predicted protein [Olea europaea subsp. europaea]
MTSIHHSNVQFLSWSAETKGDRGNADATGALVAVGAPGPDLGPGWSSETRGIEMPMLPEPWWRWEHRGQILAQAQRRCFRSLGGAPGPDLGPGWSAKTKGDRYRVACKPDAAVTGASVAVGAPGPDLGPVFNLTPRSRGIEMELHLGPLQLDCFNDYGLSLDTVHDP